MQLKKAVPYSTKNMMLIVQAMLNYYNFSHNQLTRCFAIEYSINFDFMLHGLEKLGFPILLGGSSNHFRIEKLREIGARDSYNVTDV